VSNSTETPVGFFTCPGVTSANSSRRLCGFSTMPTTRRSTPSTRQVVPAERWNADATPLAVKSGVCETPLVDFESAIYGGDVRPGCVAFSLPAHAKIAAVVFSPHSNAAKAVRWR